MSALKIIWKIIKYPFVQAGRWVKLVFTYDDLQADNAVLISYLKQSFIDGDEAKIKENLMILMLHDYESRNHYFLTGIPSGRKKIYTSEKFLKNFAFTDEQIMEITNIDDPREAKVRLTTLTDYCLEHEFSKFARLYGGSILYGYRA